MTEKLYEQNSLLKDCTGIVVNCLPKNDKFLVELDRTVFFPEGGGQLSDKGWLDNARVDYVTEKEGHIYHECDKPLEIGSAVTAKLDWKVRLDRMQQHLGEHLLSFAVWKLFKANNTGFHMNEAFVTIDLDKVLTAEELQAAENLTNEIIWENRPVTVSYLEDTEAAKLPMRKFNNNIKGLLRIIAVQDADICTCCGTHPPFTGMVGCVKIIRTEKYKQGQRIEFLCGNRAVKDYGAKNQELLRTAQMLSIKPSEVEKKVIKLKEELESAYEKLKAVKINELQKLFAQAAEEAKQNQKNCSCAFIILEDSKDIKLLQPIAGNYSGLHTVILAVQPERISYAAVAGPDTAGNCRNIIKILNEVFAGRGGGRDDSAQGGADYCSDWQEKLALAKAQLSV